MQVTQAEFARRIDVSRKTITTWKGEGRLVLQGNLIDVEPTLARLKMHHVGGAEIVRRFHEGNSEGGEGNKKAVTSDQGNARAVTPGPARNKLRGGRNNWLRAAAEPGQPDPLPYKRHLTDPFDLGAVAAAVEVVHRLGGVLALSVVSTGGQVEVAKAAEMRATCSSFEVACMVLDDLKVPPPPGLKSWDRAAVVDQGQLTAVNWSVVEAEPAALRREAAG